MNKPLHPEITVNGHVIDAGDIAAEAQNHGAPAGKPGIAWRKAARALVIRHLLLDEARRANLAPAPQEVGAGLRETQEEAMIRAVMEARVHPEPVTDAQVRARFDAAPERFCSPPLWETAHILFAAAPQDKAARQKARQTAMETAQELHRSPDRFETLAQARSACPSRENGGRLGQIGPGDTVPEFEAALAGLEPGDISENPVETRFGFHIIRLLARANGRPLPFDAVSASIREAMEKAAWVKAAKALTQQLVDEAQITGIEMEADL